MSQEQKLVEIPALLQDAVTHVTSSEVQDLILKHVRGLASVADIMTRKDGRDGAVGHTVFGPPLTGALVGVVRSFWGLGEVNLTIEEVHESLSKVIMSVLEDESSRKASGWVMVEAREQQLDKAKKEGLH